MGSLAILLPVLASRLPASRLAFFRHDLSYGTYPWAFPVQQTLAYAGLNATPVAYVAVGATTTLALAGLSWVCIERPALERRRGRMPAEAARTRPDGRAASRPAEVPARLTGRA